MGIFNKVTTKAGNKAFGIEEIKKRSELPTTQDEILQRRKQAKELIHKKSLMSSAANIVPIPGLGVGMDIKLMGDIIEDINKIYGLSHKQVNKMQDDVKQKILTSAAMKGSQFVGQKVTNAMVKVFFRSIVKREAAKQSRWIPLVGQAVAGSISYYLMKKMGEDHIKKCETVIEDFLE
ncbi:DUF697 domain-containing protein [Mammaliicoccus sp. Dog046]|uniref:DUF697 domain-containing protein n=1 Tax=Mammaliicoccus sp. Dog046 TaxID=3034233 RepID=UPI002B2635D4|nr:DUF697 domain-containing protein [Mammaliicoccus sp. Dog046]WQK84725.1 DUF697 domain-containing protein [Mammaliicoccus sp. Dog046]